MTGVRLVKYDAACRALAEAERVDDVIQIHDDAKAAAAYARIAKDARMLNNATAIRIRAQRRLGELMAAQANTVGKAEGARKPGTTRGKQNPASAPPTLAEAGIDKNLAKRARKAAAMDETEFESTVAAVEAGQANSPARPRRRKQLDVDQGADNESPDHEMEDRNNLVASFLMRADACKTNAVFSGDYATADMVKAARAVADRWSDLAEELEHALLVRSEPDTLAA